MKIAFISDIHIQSKDVETTKKFERFVHSIKNKIDQLYILGDLFEAWAGDDYQTENTEKVIQAIKSLIQSGTLVHFMRGNHDFLVGKNFLKSSHCLFIKDPTVIELNNTRVLLTHGDILINNWTYSIYRAFIQHPAVRWIAYHLIPLKWRINIAQKLNHQMELKSDTPGDQKKILKLMNKYRASYIIHGHFHRPNFETIQNNGKTLQRFVLGGWSNFDKNILMCESNKHGLSFSFASQM